MKYTRDENITLGCVARDKITGFEGVVVAITEWLNGCQRITIQPQKLDNGKRVENDTFDAEQVELVTPIEPQPEKTKSGGPSIAPKRAADPV